MTQQPAPQPNRRLALHSLILRILRRLREKQP